MASAEATGIPINLTHMAVGDGNGNFVSPDEDQTQLVHEMYRAVVNRVFQDPEVPEKFTAELIVPSSVGGFTMREVGVFDEDGSLFVVGNLPATYKPNISEGAYADTAVRIEFLVTNASVVTIQIDPNIVVATRTWITNNITAASLIPGGTVTQYLGKATNADGDVQWKDFGDLNVTVDMVEENQTLVLNQTTVTLATTTTRGLAVHIEGVRLPKMAGVDGWQIGGGGVSLTQIILGKSYPAGTRITLTQNEPTGSAPAPLERSQNLNDLPSKATARTNLDVYSKSEADQKAPVSAVMYFARATAPTGWLKANGALVNRTAYAGLFAVIGTTYGAGDGFTTFALPDVRGEFIRGLDDSRGIDVGRVLGSAQGDELKSHTHSGTTVGAYGSGPIEDGQGNPNIGTGSIGFTGGSETRPRNIAFLACIKF